LECGEDANKLCTLGEMMEIMPGWNPNTTVVNGMKNINIYNLCTLLPIIDSTEVEI